MAEAKTEPKKLPTKPYKVLQNLRHDRKHYAPNKTVRLNKKDADVLLARKVVEPLTTAVDDDEDNASDTTK